MSEMKAVEPFRRELIRVLAARGWIEGQNYVLELRSAEGRPERYPEMMRELVDRRCDVIITTGHAMTEEALRATKTTVKYLAMRRSDVNVRTYGCLAAITGFFELEVTVNGQPLAEQVRFHSLWAKRSQGIQFVSWQSTRVPPKK